MRRVMAQRKIHMRILIIYPHNHSGLLTIIAQEGAPHKGRKEIPFQGSGEPQRLVF
jgi:hypothetical protein